MTTSKAVVTIRERMMPRYKMLAQTMAWNPPEGSLFVDQRRKQIELLMADMPSGSGWDCGTKLDEDISSGERLVLFGEFHHMNENGMYDGWTAHQIIVTPSLCFGLNLRITGRDRNGIKDYLYEMFDAVLREEVDSDSIQKQAAEHAGAYPAEED